MWTLDLTMIKVLSCYMFFFRFDVCVICCIATNLPIIQKNKERHMKTNLITSVFIEDIYGKCCDKIMILCTKKNKTCLDYTKITHFMFLMDKCWSHTLVVVVICSRRQNNTQLAKARSMCVLAGIAEHRSRPRRMESRSLLHTQA